MEQTILKSLETLGKEIKVVLDQADKAQTRADDLKLTAGRLLLEAKERIKSEGKSWLDYLKEHKLDVRRSQEVMKIAKGETTSDEMRDQNAARQAKFKMRRKENALPAFSSDKNTTPDKSIQALASQSLNAVSEEKVRPQPLGKEEKEEKEPVLPIKDNNSWETDPKTIALRAEISELKKAESFEIQRLKNELIQANRKINQLTEELDDLREDTSQQKKMLRLLKELDYESYDELARQAKLN